MTGWDGLYDFNLSAILPYGTVELWAAGLVSLCFMQILAKVLTSTPLLAALRTGDFADILLLVEQVGPDIDVANEH